MKTIYVLLMALIVVLSGCEPKGGEVTYTSNLTEMIKDIEAVSAAGLTKEITFTAAQAWSAEAEDEWVTVLPEKGNAGENTITITVAPSTQLDARSMMVRFTEAGKNHDITVSQESGVPIDSKVIVEEMKIEGGLNTFTPVEVIKFTIDQYHQVSDYMLRIKANFDWVIDATTIPAIFNKGAFMDRDMKPISADKDVYTPDFVIDIDPTKLTTESQEVRVAVKDKNTGTQMWIPITVPGLGDNYIKVLFPQGFSGNVELQRMGATPVKFELSQSPAFEYKFVALESIYNADKGNYVTTLNEVDWVVFAKPLGRAALITTAHTVSAKDNSAGVERRAEVFLLPKNVSVSEALELGSSSASATLKQEYIGKAYQLYINVAQYGFNDVVEFKFANNLADQTVTYGAGETVHDPETGSGNIVKYTSNYPNKGSDTKYGLYLKINEADTTGWNASIGFGFDRGVGADPQPCIDIVLGANNGPERSVPVEVWVRHKDLKTEKVGTLTVKQSKK